MSCSSATSTHTLGAASLSFRELRWSRKTPLAWLVAAILGWERRRQYKQLLELDDRLLADMGISRTTVEEIRRSPFYLIAWRDSR